MMLFGIVVGTSSSIFIAAPILLFLGEHRLRRDAGVPVTQAGAPVVMQGGTSPAKPVATQSAVSKPPPAKPPPAKSTSAKATTAPRR